MAADPCVPAWLSSLPLAPEFHPTETEFADPITFLSRIEPLAAAAGICKVVPPLSRPPKRAALANLAASVPSFTTRHQELGSPRRPLKHVWQSGQRYTLDQFHSKSRAFSRSHLHALSHSSPLLVESLFWKAMADRDKLVYVEYANDVPGSGFSARGSASSDRLSNSWWNLREIARAPGSVTRFMPDDVQGVTTPMVYIGMLFSWFAWHVEDHDLHSMNFLHTGAAKTWYAVPAEYATRLEEVVRVEGYGGNVDQLESFSMLGEKTTLLSPEIFKAAGIPCCRLVQHPGEFVVTFPRAYHVGFSHGFNCGEAANFATPQWLNVAREAAVRRAAMNHLPMLSHQHLLYLLTMSFISRIPRELLSDVRSSRLRDRKKEEREVMVKKAFLKDMLNENRLLCALLAKDSASYVALWEPELLPSPYSGALSFPSSGSLEGHGSLVEDNQREMINSSPTGKFLVHCRRRPIGAENGLDEETVNPNNVLCNSVSPDQKENASCNVKNISSNVETVQDFDDGGDDLPCGLNVDSGSLTCVACGVLGYPFMAIMQPSERARKELFPPNSEEFYQKLGKSGRLKLPSCLPSTVGKFNSDLSEEAGIMPVVQSNLESSCTLDPASGDHVPLTEASNTGCGSGPSGLLNGDCKESSSDCSTMLGVIGGMMNMTTSGHPVESYSDGQQCKVQSKELKKSMLMSDDAIDENDPRSIRFSGLSSFNETNSSYGGPEEGSEHETNKKGSTFNRFMRPRIFCLQHALEIWELLQCKGGGNILIICHSDYNKIYAHAISVAEDTGIRFNCKDVPLENATPEDLDLINIAIDDDHQEHEDWTSELGLNLRYCIKLRKQSSTNQEQLPLALRGIFSDPSPTVTSNLKWRSRKSRTPYKVIGTVESKSANDKKIKKDEPVMGSSTADSMREIKAYQSHKHRRGDMATNHNGCPTKDTPEELSKRKEMPQFNDGAANISKAGNPHLLNQEVENISTKGLLSIPIISADSSHVSRDIGSEEKICVSDDMDCTKSGGSIPLANSLVEAGIYPNGTHLCREVRPEERIYVSDDMDSTKSGGSIPLAYSHIEADIHPNSTHLCKDARPENKICVSDDMDFTKSGGSGLLANSHTEACIHANEISKEMVVRNPISQHQSSEVLDGLNIADKPCNNSKVCDLEKSECQEDMVATEDGGEHPVIRDSDDNSSVHGFNEVINPVDVSCVRSVNHSEVTCKVPASRELELEDSLCIPVLLDYQSISLTSTDNFEMQPQVSVAEEAETDATDSPVNNIDTRRLEASVLRENNMQIKSQSYVDKFEYQDETETDTTASPVDNIDTRQLKVSELDENKMQLDRHSNIDKFEMCQQLSSASEMEENNTGSSDIQQEQVCSASAIEDYTGSFEVQQELASTSGTEENRRITVSVNSSCHPGAELVVESSETRPCALFCEEVHSDVTADKSQKPSLMVHVENIHSNGIHDLVGDRQDANATGDNSHYLEKSTEKEYRSIVVHKMYVRRNKRKRETENTTGCGSTVRGPGEVLTYVRRNKRKKETDNTTGGGTAVQGLREVLTYVRRNKRKSETRNTTGSGTFTRGPCEGLRLRTVRTQCSMLEAKAVNKVITGRVTKSVKVTKRVKVNKKVDSSMSELGEPKNQGTCKCDIKGCKMSFKTEEDLQLHKCNRCPYKGCGKHFSSHKYIMLHQRVHDDERPLKCPWEGCNMTFKWSWSRIEHVRIHTGERPYKCNFSGCGETFRFVSNMSSHRRKYGHFVE